MRWVSKFYDTKVLLRHLGLIVLTAVVGKATGGLAMLAVPILIMMSISGRRPATVAFWVLLSTFTCQASRRLFSVTFPAVMSVRGGLVLLAVMLTGGLMAGLSRKSGRSLAPFLGMMAYILAAFVSSLLGWAPVVSILKIILFVLIYIGLMGAASFASSLKKITLRQLRSVILSILAFVVIGSVLVIPFGFGMMSGEDAARALRMDSGASLFMGMTCQAQVLGATGGIVGTFIFADLVFSIKKWDRFYVLMLLSCPLLIYRSSCRTGMGTLIAGWGLVILLAMQARGLGARWKGKLTSLAVLVAVVGGIAIVAIPSVRLKAIQYVVKYDKSDDAEITKEAVMSSRQGKIDATIENFLKSPVFGNGFQVTEGMSGPRGGGLMSYLSAPMEKGTWVVAVPEETGIVGMLILCGWILALFFTLIRLRAYIGLCVFWAFLTSNLGEFTMFSMTYTGAFYWALVFFGVAMDVLREREAREARQMAMGMDMWVRGRVWRRGR